MAALRAEQPEAVPEPLVQALALGLAAHHAGCLPAWKSLIERCFQRGALWALFRSPGCTTLEAGHAPHLQTSVALGLAAHHAGCLPACLEVPHRALASREVVIESVPQLEGASFQSLPHATALDM